MRAPRFGRKLALPATIAIKHQFRMWLDQDEVKKADGDAKAEALRGQHKEKRGHKVISAEFVLAGLQGRVVVVGPGGRDESGKLIPIDVKVGDHVLFGKWSGTEVKIDGVEFLLIMKESDIMGVATEAAAKKAAA